MGDKSNGLRISPANGRVIVHIDMDAFFAAVEQHEHEEYRGKPVVVGADPRGGKGRGVVSTASYEARRYGIHSAMPISRAFKRCPHAVYLRPRMKRYAEISNQIMKLLGEFSPLIEQVSIDEAFLDCTGTESLFGSPENIARLIKKRIYVATGLTASIGVASNKTIAKIASELCKPDGVLECPPGKEKDFLASLDLKYLWGVGAKTIGILNSHGYSSIGDVAREKMEVIVKLLGRYGVRIWWLANGVDPSPVWSERLRKSIGKEITFQEDAGDDNMIEFTIFRLAEDLTRNMRRLGIKGRTVTLKVRLEDFTTFTRRSTLKIPTNSMNTVRLCALRKYREFNRKGKKVRLVGISVSGLVKEGAEPVEQITLFETNGDERDDENGAKLQRLLDNMKEKYGNKITRAAFVRSGRHGREKIE